MQRSSKWITAIWKSEIWPLLPFFTMVALLLVIGLAANKATDSTNLAFDRHVMFAFRSSSNNFETPIGPPWVQETARDVTSLGSFAVLGLVLLVATGYFLAVRNWKYALFLLFSFLGVRRLTACSNSYSHVLALICSFRRFGFSPRAFQVTTLPFRRLRT